MDQVRTCVGCRLRAPRTRLTRVALLDDQFTIDHRAVLPGRGAWVHLSEQCIERAVSRGVLARALRATGQPDVSPLENRLKTLMDN